jgi:hypothetical protein
VGLGRGTPWRWRLGGCTYAVGVGCRLHRYRGVVFHVRHRVHPGVDRFGVGCHNRAGRVFDDGLGRGDVGVDAVGVPPRNAGSGVNDGIWLALIGALGSAGFGGVVVRLGCSGRKLKAETGATIDARWKAYADQLERRLEGVEAKLSKASARIEAQDDRMDVLEADLDRAVKAKKQVDALWRQWAFDVETAGYCHWYGDRDTQWYACYLHSFECTQQLHHEYTTGHLQFAHVLYRGRIWFYCKCGAQANRLTLDSSIIFFLN